MSFRPIAVCMLAYRGRRNGRFGNNRRIGNDGWVCNGGSGGAFRDRAFREVRLRVAILSGRILWRIRRRGVWCFGFMLSAIKRVEQGDRCKNDDRCYKQKKHEQKGSISSRMIFLITVFHAYYSFLHSYDDKKSICSYFDLVKVTPSILT